MLTCNLFQHTCFSYLKSTFFILSYQLHCCWLDDPHRFPGPTHSTGGRGVDVMTMTMAGGVGGGIRNLEHIYVHIMLRRNPLTLAQTLLLFVQSWLLHWYQWSQALDDMRTWSEKREACCERNLIWMDTFLEPKVNMVLRLPYMMIFRNWLEGVAKYQPRHCWHRKVVTGGNEWVNFRDWESTPSNKTLMTGWKVTPFLIGEIHLHSWLVFSSQSY